MLKLLTASLLLANCALHPAYAQKVPAKHPAPHKSKTAHPPATGLPATTVSEFCLNYPRYYFDLPAQYRENAYWRFKAAGLTLTPDVPFTTVLAKSSALREVAYNSLYLYCADIQFMYRRPTDEVMFIYLYNILHLHTGPATLLAQYSQKRYQHLLAPPASTISPAAQSAVADDSDTEEPNNTQQAENKVYSYVEQMPALPGGGGMGAIVKAIQAAVRYPTDAVRDSVQGRVFVDFVVDTVGGIANVRVRKALSPSTNAEAIRAVKALPKFIPGRQGNKPVNVAFTVPVTFTLTATPLSKPTQ